ncbi:hypothetical protein Misp05_04490 [Micromonospora sp. NBRC 107095]|nr:hypothetical protein Misp05_04490 [Micromonospora sp. NBRC 107095]
MPLTGQRHVGRAGRTGRPVGGRRARSTGREVGPARRGGHDAGAGAYRRGGLTRGRVDHCRLPGVGFAAVRGGVGFAAVRGGVRSDGGGTGGHLGGRRIVIGVGRGVRDDRCRAAVGNLGVTGG